MPDCNAHTTSVWKVRSLFAYRAAVVAVCRRGLFRRGLFRRDWDGTGEDAICFDGRGEVGNATCFDGEEVGGAPRTPIQGKKNDKINSFVVHLVRSSFYSLTSEAIQGSAIALERIDDIHCGDGLAARVLGVGYGVADYVLKVDLEHTAGLLVYQTGHALDAATAS